MTIIRTDGTTHEMPGQAPGWAHCDDWIPAAAAPLPPGTPVDCPGCQRVRAAHEGPALYADRQS
jgi:hypothetical protein